MKLVSLSLSTIVLAASCNAFLSAEETLIPRGDSGWRYLDGPNDPGRDWQSHGFDDSRWREGQAMLGYGDQDVKTRLSFGNNAQNKPPAVFFRKRIGPVARRPFKRLLGRVCCDDGAVVYINRQEVFRRLRECSSSSVCYR